MEPGRRMGLYFDGFRSSHHPFNNVEGSQESPFSQHHSQTKYGLGGFFLSPGGKEVFGFGIKRWLLKLLTGNGQPQQWKVAQPRICWKKVICIVPLPIP